MESSSHREQKDSGEEMIDNNDLDDILSSIELGGAASTENAVENQIILGSRNNLNHIAGVSSGRMKIYPSIAKKFQLLLTQPAMLKALNPFEIRCVLCKQVISYPAWYYSIKYAVNHFHYFVCFDSSQPTKPTTKCYRRDA